MSRLTVTGPSLPDQTKCCPQHNWINQQTGLNLLVAHGLGGRNKAVPLGGENDAKSSSIRDALLTAGADDLAALALGSLLRKSNWPRCNSSPGSESHERRPADPQMGRRRLTIA